MRLFCEYVGVSEEIVQELWASQVAFRASLVAQMVKNPPVMQETWVQSLSREDTLEKETFTFSNILAWEIPWTEEPGGLTKESQKDHKCD